MQPNVQLGTDMEYSVILSLMSDGRIDWWTYPSNSGGIIFDNLD